MKKWFVAFAISFTLSVLGLAYFTVMLAQDRCRDSGGNWLGLLKGCEEGSGYQLEFTGNPLAMTIFLAIVVAISSALIQLHSILFQRNKKLP